MMVGIVSVSLVCRTVTAIDRYVTDADNLYDNPLIIIKTVHTYF